MGIVKSYPFRCLLLWKSMGHFMGWSDRIERRISVLVLYSGNWKDNPVIGDIYEMDKNPRVLCPLSWYMSTKPWNSYPFRCFLFLGVDGSILCMLLNSGW